VAALPSKELRNSIVSTESRNGTCLALAPSALITLPNAVRDPLIAIACVAATPSTPVLRIRSDPARSTNNSRFLVT